MMVGIATDHGRFGLKGELVSRLRAAGHEVIDYGAHHPNPGDDCPDFVARSPGPWAAAWRSAEAGSARRFAPTRFWASAAS